MKLLSGFVVALALSSTAWADNKSDAAAAYAEGQKKYNAEDYAAAARLFLEAYNLDPDPAYLFNGAQAYRFAKLCADASTHYKKFLEVIPSAPNADQVRAYITEMDACAKEQAAAMKPPPAEPVVSPRQPDPMPVAPPAAEGGGVRKPLAFGLIGLGVVGAVGGVLLQVRVGNLEDERAALCPPGETPCMWTAEDSDAEKKLQEKGDRAARYSVASFVVGGAALVGGIVLLVTNKQPANEHAMRVIPTSNGALVRWSF